jgi:hypothetical protein
LAGAVKMFTVFSESPCRRRTLGNFTGMRQPSKRKA